MKVVLQLIECIAWFDDKGRPTPLRFRILDDNGNKTVKVDHIIHREIQKIEGKDIYIFDCQSKFRDQLKIYQLRYHLDTCKWILFKI